MIHWSLAKVVFIDTKRNNVNPPAFFGEPPREFAPPLEKVNPLWSYLHPLKRQNEPPEALQNAPGGFIF